MNSLTEYMDSAQKLPAVSFEELEILPLKERCQYYSRHLIVRVRAVEKFTKIVSQENWEYWDYIANGASSFLENQKRIDNWETGFGTSAHYYIRKGKNSFVLKPLGKRDVFEIDIKAAISYSRQIQREICFVVNTLSGYSEEFDDRTKTDDALVEFNFLLHQFVIQGRT